MISPLVSYSVRGDGDEKEKRVQKSHPELGGSFIAGGRMFIAGAYSRQSSERSHRSGGAFDAGPNRRD